jgi:beta-galactosidase
MRLAATALILALAAAPAAGQTPKAHAFTVQGDQFNLDGQPFVIRSGELHYPRVPREYWRDRMRKMRALGLNTLCTYVFWNLHEPVEGRFDFSGQRDLAAFLRTAQEEGLFVILRPGPYICTEWDFGGLPAWLLAKPGMKVRENDPAFLAASARYLARVGREVAGLQAPDGGPVILVQVENEYGSFGADHAYMAAIRDQIEAAGFTKVPRFTSDGPSARLLAGGTLPGVASVINFDAADDPDKQFAAFAAFRPGAPRMCGEYWAGWFDHWGRPHHTVDAARGAAGVDWMLARGISFNLYMFHGGTTFGFMAGANWDGGRYWPDTTSYDYDGLLDEAGRPTPKFEAYRAVLRKHLPAGAPTPALPAPLPVIAVPAFAFREHAPLAQLLANPVRSEAPLSMEALGQAHGFVLYRTVLDKAVAEVLDLGEVRDHAVVLQAGRAQGALDRRLKQTSLDVRLRPGALDLLVENMGRINFARAMQGETKGLAGPVKLAGRDLKGWECFPLPMDDLSALRFSAERPEGPAFHRATFDLKAPGDTFLDLRGWGKGFVVVNGHNLGRFWRIGPQQTLYCPAPWLKAGRNEVIVFDLEATGPLTMQGLQDPVFDNSPLR